MTSKKQTIAEELADLMGNDGSSISDIEIAMLNAEAPGNCVNERARWEFEDGSAICEVNVEPYSWRG